VCGLLNNDFFCARSQSTAAGPAFEPLVRRIKNATPSTGSNGMTMPDFERGRIVSGRLYPVSIGGTPVKRTGFCWVDPLSHVSCSNPWR